ncbi:MAG: hypothetical protein K9G44_06985 [Melioribacteraceae bacterium]|nr:hypothetical protein [Melioribacteraceae bacterium]
MTKLEVYNKINRSYKKKLVFNFGSEAGFYSEFNNMVFAILFCLKYRYRFILYSFDAQFKVYLGWDDYFEPFCDSTNFSFHQRYNSRNNIPIVSRRDLIYKKLYKLLNPNTFLTQQLWPEFFNPEFEKEQFDIPELGIKGNLRESSRKIVEMIYNFNSPTKRKINSIIDQLNLPKNYASVHIRRGDKKSEVEFLQTSVYIDKLKQETDLKSIFVLTDDYAVFKKLKSDHPEFIYYSLIEKNEKGYFHDNFVRLDKEEIQRKMLLLFSSMEIICNSECFVGAYTNNPGLFAAMRLADNKIHSIQKASWYQFEDFDVSNHFLDTLRESKSKS